MAIQELDIKEYRSITRPMKLKLDASLNIFIGQHNSGKTNILDAIEGLCTNSKEVKGKVTAKTERQIKLIRLSDMHDIDYQQIDLDYKKLSKDPKQLKTFQTLLASYFPQLSSRNKALDMNLQQGVPVVKEHGETVVFDRLGSGFQKIFIILLYALHPDYNVVLLDEPETHLHPALIKRLRKVLASGVTNQIIMTTHSPLFIASHNLHQLYRVARTEEQGTHYHNLAESGFKLNRQRFVQEFNADNLEMFFADRVLLVEGVSDRILMRGLIDRFYRGPLEIKVVYTHGKGNTDVYMNLLRAFHIDYVVMLDRDALGWWTTEFLRQRHVRIKKRKNNQTIEELKKFHIYVLPNGNIENNYPRKYQKEKKKPLNALIAASQITKEEYNGNGLKNLRGIIDSLIGLSHDTDTRT